MSARIDNPATTDVIPVRGGTTARRRVRRLVAVTALTAAAVAFPASAHAHVRVFPETASGGGFAKLTFRVPNESDTAGTTALTVTLPADAPFTSVSVQPVPGWTAKVAKAKLTTPVTVEGTSLTEAARTITWTAAPGTQIAPGQFQEFAISVGRLPESGELLFPATQTYSDGTNVAWDQPHQEGAAEPEHPAPALTITPAEQEGASATAGTVAAANSVTTGEAAGDDADAVARWLSAAALVVALAGLTLSLVRRRTGATDGT